MAEIRIEGSPYSAEFLTTADEGVEQSSGAYGIITPPFDFMRAANLVDLNQHGSMTIEDYATTISATVLQFTVQNDGNFHTGTHERRINCAKDTLKGIVEELNEIESGTFRKELRGA